jgi:hypothetical protein
MQQEEKSTAPHVQMPELFPATPEQTLVNAAIHTKALEIVQQAIEVRTAQKRYYAHPGNPKTDQAKKDLMVASKQEEGKLDKMLMLFEE